MEVFKLAFETTVVGVLAFLWLGIAIDLLFPPFFAEIVPAALGKNDTLLGVGILSLAYCIGSAIVPISSQLVNDEHWPVTEDAIRCLVLEHQNDRLHDIVQDALLKPYEPGDNFEVCHGSFWDSFREKDATNRRVLTRRSVWGGLAKIFEHKDEAREEQEKEAERLQARGLNNVLTKFQLIESRILSQGSDKTERLRQLHERIVVLRGAVFSGFSLFLICLFGSIAPTNGQPFPWERRLGGIFLATALTLFSAVNAYQDLIHFNIFDIPVLEGLLGVITVFGGFLTYYGVKARPYLGMRFVVVVGFFAALAYGGWIWSEVIYDQQVISSYTVLETAAKP